MYQKHLNVPALFHKLCTLIIISVFCTGIVIAQKAKKRQAHFGAEFGPVVRAYLDYLKTEEEVVDDRASRHEVNPVYYRRNMNRIRALRQMAVTIARESKKDYLPELEAVTSDELTSLFETPPDLDAVQVGEVLGNTFRFLGTIRTGEAFYLFARLDSYEQSELVNKEADQRTNNPEISIDNSEQVNTSNRPRRVDQATFQKSH